MRLIPTMHRAATLPADVGRRAAIALYVRAPAKPSPRRNGLLHLTPVLSPLVTSTQTLVTTLQTLAPYVQLKLFAIMAVCRSLCVERWSFC